MSVVVEKIERLIVSKGGKCISLTYTGPYSRVEIQCSAGHLWETNIYNLRYRNSWCPFCNNRKNTIDSMCALAESKGGKCLSSTYINSDEPLLWECRKGHRWEAPARHIKNHGSWCKECFQEKLGKPTIEAMHQLAKERNGKCLSTKYVNAITRLLWECEFGHQWKASPHNIKSKNSWCPICADQKKAQQLKTIRELHQ